MDYRNSFLYSVKLIENNSYLNFPSSGYYLELEFNLLNLLHARFDLF